MKNPNHILGLSILATILALVSMPKEEGKLTYQRLVNLSKEIKEK